MFHVKHPARRTDRHCHAGCRGAEPQRRSLWHPRGALIGRDGRLLGRRLPTQRGTSAHSAGYFSPLRRWHWIRQQNQPYRAPGYTLSTQA